MKKSLLITFLVLGLLQILLWLRPSSAAPGNLFNDLGKATARSIQINSFNYDSNQAPLQILDQYGSNIFSFTPSASGSNYWHFLVGDFTPNKQLAQNISDMIFKMTQNGYWQVDFGSITNTFWSFGSRFSWGDTLGADQALFDRQARFFPEHIEGQLVNNNISPTLVIGAAAGSGGSPSVVMVNADTYDTDVAMKIQLVTGSASLGAGTLFTVTFKLAYANAPKVVFSPRSSTTAPEIAKMYVSSTTTTTFVMSSTAALTAGTTYVWDFIVIQ